MMIRLPRSVLGFATSLALLLLSGPVAAKRTGVNLPCHNCHEGQDKPELTIMPSATRVQPGETVTFTITAKHPRAKIGGVLIDSNGMGRLELLDSAGTRLFDASTTQAVHAMPQPYANGQVQFSFRWIAPPEPSAVMFDIWTNAANDNSKPDDDSAHEVVAAVSVGCDGAWYYTDSDRDGTGVEAGKVFSCTPIPDRILVGGDCDDGNPNVSPKAAELCNSIDDDCDGLLDDGFTPGLLFTDADGDGYGVSIGTTAYGCPPMPGFAPNFDDCNDRDAATRPGAAEISNGRDDDCDGQVDEANATPGTGGTGSAAPPAPLADGSGCAVAAPAPSRAFPALGALLLLGMAARRGLRRANQGGPAARRT